MWTSPHTSTKASSSVSSPISVLSIPGWDCGIDPATPLWKILVFSKPVFPAMPASFPQCSSHSLMSPGPRWEANPAVPLHGCALFYLYVKSIMKTPCSRGLVVWGRGCLYLPTSAVCCEAYKVTGTQSQGELPSGLGAGTWLQPLLSPLPRSWHSLGSLQAGKSSAAAHRELVPEHGGICMCLLLLLENNIRSRQGGFLPKGVGLPVLRSNPR